MKKVISVIAFLFLLVMLFELFPDAETGTKLEISDTEVETRIGPEVFSDSRGERKNVLIGREIQILDHVTRQGIQGAEVSVIPLLPGEDCEVLLSDQFGKVFMETVGQSICGIKAPGFQSIQSFVNDEQEKIYLQAYGSLKVSIKGPTGVGLPNIPILLIPPSAPEKVDWMGFEMSVGQGSSVAQSAMEDWFYTARMLANIGELSEDDLAEFRGGRQWRHFLGALPWTHYWPSEKVLPWHPFSWIANTDGMGEVRWQELAVGEGYRWKCLNSINLEMKPEYELEEFFAINGKLGIRQGLAQNVSGGFAIKKGQWTKLEGVVNPSSWITGWFGDLASAASSAPSITVMDLEFVKVDGAPSLFQRIQEAFQVLEAPGDFKVQIEPGVKSIFIKWWEGMNLYVYFRQFEIHPGEIIDLGEIVPEKTRVEFFTKFVDEEKNLLSVSPGELDEQFCLARFGVTNNSKGAKNPDLPNLIVDLNLLVPLGAPFSIIGLPPCNWEIFKWGFVRAWDDPNSHFYKELPEEYVPFGGPDIPGLGAIEREPRSVFFNNLEQQDVAIPFRVKSSKRVSITASTPGKVRGDAKMLWYSRETEMFGSRPMMSSTDRDRPNPLTSFSAFHEFPRTGIVDVFVILNSPYTVLESGLNGDNLGNGFFSHVVLDMDSITDEFPKIETELQPGRTISGKLLDKEDRPVAGCFVSAHLKGYGSQVVPEGFEAANNIAFSSYTDDKGNFVLMGAPIDLDPEFNFCDVVSWDSSRREVSVVLKARDFYPLWEMRR